MSFLYPLFLAGVAAVALPILLHMIRRHTRRRVAFSSLMFLRPTMPRFKSRSRLEHIPLLILRCLIVCLLAFAFARPFLVRPAAVSEAPPGGRIALLIDTSASMRRTGVWAQAIDEARSVLADAGPADRLCVMTFDQTTHPVIGFEQWAVMDPARRAAIATQSIGNLSPSWASTDLGHALVAAAEAIEDDEVNDGQQDAGLRRVVLISDLQQGSNLDALTAYEWPGRTELAVKAVPCAGTTNASLQWITSRDTLASPRGDQLPGVRVTNSPDADRDRFQLHWGDNRQTDVYVPAGRSVVVRAPAGSNPSESAKLVLTGDDHDFDNTLYLTPQPRRDITILYIGNDDANDPGEMLYYVRRAFGTGAALTARVIRRSGSEPIGPADIETTGMVLVTDLIGERNLAPLRRYVESGGVLLVVVKSPEAITTLSGLAGIERIDCRETDAGQYAMLDRIDLEHPLLKPFSDPRFGDFTRIHFWRHRRIDAADCPGARVLARFDNDDPAWLEVPVGRGSLLVWTGGWQPSDSDLALSSKFVPLLYSALEYGGAFAGHQPQYFVGDPVPMPEPVRAGLKPAPASVAIRRPDDSVVHLDTAGQAFTQTDLPGIYSISDLGLRTADLTGDANPQFFAVNLPAGESRTDPMPIEELERRGVSLESAPGIARASAKREAQRASLGEMESQQKLWRWVFVAILAMLLAEVWLGGWLTRPSPASREEQT